MKTKSASASSSPRTVVKVDLSAILQPTKETPEYPSFKDAELVDSILKLSGEIEVLEEKLARQKETLISKAKSFFFQLFEGKPEPSTAVRAEGFSEHVLVVMQNRYSACEDEAALSTLMGDAYEEFVEQVFSLKIDGSKIPAESQGKLVSAIVALCAEHRASEALSAKSEIKPKEEFHVLRHSKFTPATNLAIDSLTTMTALVKTKGLA